MTTSGFNMSKYEFMPNSPGARLQFPATEQTPEPFCPSGEPDDGEKSDDALDGDELNSLPPDDLHWDVFLPDGELEPLPEPGDFWFDDG